MRIYCSTKLPVGNRNIYFAHIYHIPLLNNCNTLAERKAVAIIISRCGCGCYRKRQSPVASRRLTGNHKHPWQRAGSSSSSTSSLFSTEIHGSVAQQVVVFSSALESCGHFTLLFILLLIFSLYCSCPSPCLFLFLVGFCAELCKL